MDANKCSKWYYIYYNGKKIKRLNEIKDTIKGEIKLVEKHHVESKVSFFKLVCRHLEESYSFMSKSVKENAKNNKYNRTKKELNVFYIEYVNINIEKFKIKTVVEKKDKIKMENRNKIEIEGLYSFNILKQEKINTNFLYQKRKQVKNKELIYNIIIIILFILIAVGIIYLRIKNIEAKNNVIYNLY